MNKDTRTNEELNRIIAQWMGWKLAVDPHFNGLKNAGQNHGHRSIWWTEIPSYCTDLNAIHEAESKWCEQAGPDDASHPKYVYGSYLYNIVVPHDRQPFRAAARQRAETLVAVIESTKP